MYRTSIRSIISTVLTLLQVYHLHFMFFLVSNIIVCYYIKSRNVVFITKNMCIHLVYIQNRFCINMLCFVYTPCTRIQHGTISSGKATDRDIN